MMSSKPPEITLEEIFTMVLGKNVNTQLLNKCIKLYLKISNYSEFQRQNIPYETSLKIEKSLFNSDGTKKDLEIVLIEQNEIRRKQMLQERLNNAIIAKNDLEVENALRDGASAKDIIIGYQKYSPLDRALNQLTTFKNDNLNDIILLLLQNGADPNMTNAYN